MRQIKHAGTAAFRRCPTNTRRAHQPRQREARRRHTVQVVAEGIEVGYEVKCHRAQQPEVERGIRVLERVRRPVDDAYALAPRQFGLRPLQQVANAQPAVGRQHTHNLRLDAGVAAKAFGPVGGQRPPSELGKARQKAHAAPLDARDQRRGQRKVDAVHVRRIDEFGRAAPDSGVKRRDRRGLVSVGPTNLHCAVSHVRRGVGLHGKWVVEEDLMAAQRCARRLAQQRRRWWWHPLKEVVA